MRWLHLATVLRIACAEDLASGEHFLQGRKFTVATPDTQDPAPVLIMLHGNGGTGLAMQCLFEKPPSSACRTCHRGTVTSVCHLKAIPTCATREVIGVSAP